MSIRTTLAGTTVALVTMGSLLASAAAFANFGGPEMRDPERQAQRKEFGFSRGCGPSGNVDFADRALGLQRKAEGTGIALPDHWDTMTHAERRAFMEENGIVKTMPQRNVRGFGGHDSEKFQEMRSALESGDYGAWRAALEGSGRHAGMLGVITEENFGQFVAMHARRQEGNHEAAQALAEALGLPRGPGNEFGRGKGPGRFAGGDCPFLQE